MRKSARIPIQDLVKLAAIALDNGGKHLSPPFFTLESKGNPLLDYLLDGLTRGYEFVIFKQFTGETRLMAVLHSYPSAEDVEDLNKMGMFVCETDWCK